MRLTGIICSIMCLSSMHVFAQSDANTTVTTVRTEVNTHHTHAKKSKSLFTKFEDLFSDYDRDFFRDIMLYPLDVMMPDEIFKSGRDVLKYRDRHGYGHKKIELPKTVCTDTCNLFLTTSYYYMQDVSHITQRIWDDTVCRPDSFNYDPSKDPKIMPDLNIEDKRARGRTENGVVIPYNPNFPDAQYPYASAPDGCSAEELEFIYDLSNTFSNDDKQLRRACNDHDRCYYTEGTTYKECNEKFIVEAIDACNAINMKKTLITVGTKNAFCNMKALAVATGANICARKYFKEAQKRQKAYNKWVKQYEKKVLTF